MNSMCWGHGWHEVQLSPWWIDSNATPAPGQEFLWQAEAISSQSQARDLLGDAGGQAAAMRAALGDASTDLTRLNDAQLIEHVAGLLASGQFVLQRKALTAEAALNCLQDGPRPKSEAGGAGSAATVKSVISPTFAMPQRAGAPAPAPAPAEEAPVSDFESVDQDMQAAALQQAAVDGVPFCEVCEKAKREREAAGQAA